MVKRLIQLVGSSVFFLLDSIFAWCSARLNRVRRGTCCVIYYHSVSAQARQRFKKQLQMINKFSSPISTEHCSRLEDGRHYVAVTFDDGYRSVIENAIPELHAAKIPATLFLPTGHFGKTPEWVDQEIGSYRHEEIAELEEFLVLDQDLISIGSHSVTHSNLTLQNPAIAKKELAQSKSVLEDRLGRSVGSFAFPFGAYNSALVELAREAGYKRVFSCDQSLCSFNSDEILLGRIDVYPDDWTIEFFLKMSGSYRWLPYAVAVKRSIKRMLRLPTSADTYVKEV